MDRANVLIWNVRGLNDRARRDNLRKVVDDSKPAVVCLQETKLSNITERDVTTFLGRDFTNFVFLPAQQTRGGILVAWKEGSFEVSQHRVHRHSVSVLFSNQVDPPWWFTGVYGPHRDDEKLAFLDELREVRSYCHGPWMLAGDFNMIWSNERDSPTLVKLDRVLCTNDWEDIYMDCVLQTHATEMSDHCPLILGLREGFIGKRRFHFESFWTRLDGFHETVQKSWESPVQDCSPLLRIQSS